MSTRVRSIILYVEGEHSFWSMANLCSALTPAASMADCTATQSETEGCFVRERTRVDRNWGSASEKSGLVARKVGPRLRDIQAHATPDGPL